MNLNLPFGQAGHLSAGSGKTRVHLIYWRSFGALLVSVVGGRPHVGAVTAGFRLNGKKLARTFSLPRHKDEVITKKLHFILARKINGPFLISAGVHYDKAAKEDIQGIVKNSETLGRQLLKLLFRSAM